MTMIIANTRELQKEQRKYLDLAKTQKVFIKRGKDLFELRLAKKLVNPSPSGDKFFDNPEVLDQLEQAKKAARTGPHKKLNIEQLNELLGLTEE